MPTPDSDLRELVLDRSSHTGTRGGVEKVVKVTVVAALHIALALALVTGVFRPQVETLLTPLEVRVIEERPPPPRAVEPRPLPMSPKPPSVHREPKSPPPQQPQVMQSATEAPPVAIALAPPPASVPEAQQAPPPAPAAAPRTAARFNADYLKNPPPTYPALSRRNGEEGKVMLRVLVSPDGTPKSVEIDRSSGFPRLDTAAQDAVHRWRFVPAKRGTEPIEDWVLVPIVFQLAS